MKKQTKIIICLAAVLLVLVAAALVVPKMFTADTQDGQKTFTFTVVYEDGTDKQWEISTDEQYLADALIDEKLIDAAEKQSGMYTVIDGVKADYNVDGAWWCVTEGGEMTSVGMNDLAVEDGDSFEATYTKN